MKVTVLFFSTVLISTSLALPTTPSLRVRQRASTEDDLVNGQCGAATFIFARGTTEGGNVGTVVGPPFVNDLEQVVAGTVVAQGVEYAADIPGFLAGGDDAGAATMAGLVQQSITQCPGSPVIVSGYSQGAQVARKAVAQLTAAEASNIKAVVLFGDPNNSTGEAFPNVAADQVKVFCNNGDLICDGQAIVLAPHLAYGRDTGDAAAFVQSQL